MCVWLSRTDSGLCIYHLFVGSNFKFLHNSQWIPLATQSCLVLYSFCANLLHSLIMRLMVSTQSPQNLYLVFCCVLSILTLIWLVLMALFCAAIRRDLVSLLGFDFLSHVQVFSCEMSLVSRLKRQKSCFSSHFCFLVIVVPLILMLVLFLVTVINPSLCFSMLSSSRYIDASRLFSMLVSSLPLPSLTHIVYQRHLWDASPYVSSLVFLFSGPFIRVLFWFTSKMVPVSYEEDSPVIYSFGKVPAIEFCLK